MVKSKTNAREYRMSDYPLIKEGESVRLDLDKNELRFSCCDCGLVHTWRFIRVKKNIWDFVLFRENRSTGQIRRYRFKHINFK